MVCRFEIENVDVLSTSDRQSCRRQERLSRRKRSLPRREEAI